MIWHEIVKYSPKNYDDNGVYIKDEWSSRSDIGAVYDGKPFTLEEYLDVEQRYVNVVLSIMRATNCKYMTIQYLEADKDYIAKQIKASKYREIDCHLLMSISLGGRKKNIHRENVGYTAPCFEGIHLRGIVQQRAWGICQIWI